MHESLARLAATLLGLARALEAQGNLEETRQQLEFAERFDPDNPTAHYRLWQLHQKRGDASAAAEELKKFEQATNEQRDTWREVEKAVRGSAEPEIEGPDDS